jgi:hypothetical protein
MAAGKEGNLQLGANAISGTDENRPAQPRKPVSGAERADISEHARRKSLPGELLDRGYGPLSLVDIHTCIAISDWRAL